MAIKVTGEQYYDLDGQLAEIKRQLRQSCGYPHDPTELKRRLQEIIEWQFPKNEISFYPVTVNYDLSIEYLVQSGRYDWKSGNVSDRNFPTVCSGEARIEIVLVHFNRAISTEDALSELDRQGLKPADLHTLLSLGAKYQNPQRQFPIVALGSVWQGPDGSRYVPCLDWYGSGRILELNCVDDDRPAVCRFAAVRK